MTNVHVLRQQLEHLERNRFHRRPDLFECGRLAEDAAVPLGDEHSRRRAQLVQADALAPSPAAVPLQLGWSAASDGGRGRTTRRSCWPAATTSWAATCRTSARTTRPSKSRLRGVELLTGDEPDEVAAAHHLALGVALAHGRAFNQARRHFDFALERSTGGEDPNLRLLAVNNLTFLHLETGDPGSARAAAEELYQDARGGWRVPPLVLDTLGHVHLAADEPEAVVELISPLDAAPPRTTTRQAGAADALLTLASAHRRLGQNETAVAVLDRCMSLARDESMARTHALARRELTGLPGRQHVDATVPTMLDVAAGPLSVVLVDLDGFAALNEAAGRRAADEVLFTVAAMLREAVRPPSFAARLGGQAGRRCRRARPASGDRWPAACRRRWSPAAGPAAPRHPGDRVLRGGHDVRGAAHAQRPSGGGGCSGAGGQARRRQPGARLRLALRHHGASPHTREPRACSSVAATRSSRSVPSTSTGRARRSRSTTTTCSAC